MGQAQMPAQVSKADSELLLQLLAAPLEGVAAETRGAAFEAAGSATPMAGIMSLLPAWQQIAFPQADSKGLCQMRWCTQNLHKHTSMI